MEKLMFYYGQFVGNLTRIVGGVVITLCTIIGAMVVISDVNTGTHIVSDLTGGYASVAPLKRR